MPKKIPRFLSGGKGFEEMAYALIEN